MGRQSKKRATILTFFIHAYFSLLRSWKMLTHQTKWERKRIKYSKRSICCAYKWWSWADELCMQVLQACSRYNDLKNPHWGRISNTFPFNICTAFHALMPPKQSKDERRWTESDDDDKMNSRWRMLNRFTSFTTRKTEHKFFSVDVCE